MKAELTEREWEVVALLVQGYASPQIAERLVISGGTVLFHRQGICAKLGVNAPFAVDDRAARLDELERISEATLDADTDVWSLTDDGQVISLTERIDEVRKS